MAAGHLIRTTRVLQFFLLYFRQGSNLIDKNGRYQKRKTMYIEDERAVPQWIRDLDKSESSTCTVACTPSITDNSSCNEFGRLYSDTGHPLPLCIFDPEDVWFGRSFIGDEEYKIWYEEYRESLIEASFGQSDDAEEWSEEEFVYDEY